MTPAAFQIKIANKTGRFFKYLRTHPFLSFGYLVLTGFAFVGILFICTYAGLFGHVPNEHELAKLENPVTSTVYGSDKKPILRHC